MTDIQKAKLQENKIISDIRERYITVFSAKVYYFDYPYSNSLEENYAALVYLKDELFKYMKNKEEQEKEAKEIEKSDKQPKEDCPCESKD